MVTQQKCYYLLQKLMMHPESHELFSSFDSDGDGAHPSHRPSTSIVTVSTTLCACCVGCRHPVLGLLRVPISQRCEMPCARLLLARRSSLDISPCSAGEISAAELQQGMMQIGEEVSPEELQAMMAVVDVDGSGSVNYDEFAPVGKIADGLKRLERSFAQEKVNREHADRKALQLGQRIDEIDAQIAAWSA